MEKRNSPLFAVLTLMSLVLLWGCAESAKEAKSGKEGKASPSVTMQAKGEQAKGEEKSPRLTSTGVKKRIGVMDFENRTDYGAGRLGHAASEMLVTTLSKTGQFIVVEREGLDKVLKEQG